MLAAFVFVACYVPSPLYGTWADNNGNKITFISDGTFAAQIKDGAGTRKSFSGDYSTVDNVLTLSYQWEGVSYSMNTGISAVRSCTARGRLMETKRSS